MYISQEYEKYVPNIKNHLYHIQTFITLSIRSYEYNDSTSFIFNIPKVTLQEYKKNKNECPILKFILKK